MGESWLVSEREPYSVAIFVPKLGKNVYIVPPWDRRFNTQSRKLIQLLAKYPEILGQFYVFAIIQGDISKIEIVKGLIKKILL